MSLDVSIEFLMLTQLMKNPLINNNIVFCKEICNVIDLEQDLHSEPWGSTTLWAMKKNPWMIDWK
jgi:hypothetical protein